MATVVGVHQRHGIYPSDDGDRAQETQERVIKERWINVLRRWRLSSRNESVLKRSDDGTRYISGTGKEKDLTFFGEEDTTGRRDGQCDDLSQGTGREGGRSTSLRMETEFKKLNNGCHEEWRRKWKVEQRYRGRAIYLVPDDADRVQQTRTENGDRLGFAKNGEGMGLDQRYREIERYQSSADGDRVNGFPERAIAAVVAQDEAGQSPLIGAISWEKS
ncbi:hypothetical protein B296_00008882 [Ensete ventricosum]|uniref:Uncharacterized protein n=2 Tax=Ensete ventricosum TaxID=4639 RepID=A0A427BAU9_ENSVE|nr:hypothetical protein B296_00008882 [Ensete ventricosum]